jgi:hypothetical protein
MKRKERRCEAQNMVFIQQLKFERKENEREKAEVRLNRNRKQNKMTDVVIHKQSVVVMMKFIKDCPGENWIV